MGNALTNAITGTAGANVLDGAGGNDTLTGLAGNDTYVVDSTGDVVVEAAKGGSDTVKSTVSYTLGQNVENLILQGATNINGVGNSAANQLTGNAGSNLLDGAQGSDTLTGLAGNDTYVVDSSSDRIVEDSAGGVDSVRASINFTLGQYLENLELTGTAISGLS